VIGHIPKKDGILADMRGEAIAYEGKTVEQLVEE